MLAGTFKDRNKSKGNTWQSSIHYQQVFLKSEYVTICLLIIL